MGMWRHMGRGGSYAQFPPIWMDLFVRQRTPFCDECCLRDGENFGFKWTRIQHSEDQERSDILHLFFEPSPKFSPKLCVVAAGLTNPGPWDEVLQPMMSVVAGG